MIRTMIAILLACVTLPALVGGSVSAQGTVPPGWSPLLPPPPAPPPPPKIEVPVIPKLNEVPQPSYARPSRGSFSDRATQCLHDAGAAGLRGARRDAYTRACANQ